MASREPGFGKPRWRRAEPREFGDPAAAPELLTAVREQVRAHDNAPVRWLQSGMFADTAIFSLEGKCLIPCVVHTVLGGG